MTDNLVNDIKSSLIYEITTATNQSIFKYHSKNAMTEHVLEELQDIR